MRKSIWNPFLLLPGAAILLIFFSGCDTSSTEVTSTDVENAVWLPNESGMLAYIEKEYLSELDGSESLGDNLYTANSGGGIGNSINPNDVAPYTVAGGGIYWNAPILFLSSDGNTAITQFGTDIFSITLSNGNITDIIQNTALLGVSPDMKYAITTTSEAPPAAQIITVWNLTTTPISYVGTPKTVPKLISNRVLWLNNDQFAVTIQDSVNANGIYYDHVQTYDINGNSILTIPNGDVSFSAGAFAPDSNWLFVRNFALGIDRIKLATGARDTIVASDTVESVDVSADGTLVVYSVGGNSATTYNLIAVNVEDGKRVSITNGISKPILSPQKDKIACINSGATLQVVGTQFPP